MSPKELALAASSGPDSITGQANGQLYGLDGGLSGEDS